MLELLNKVIDKSACSGRQMLFRGKTAMMSARGADIMAGAALLLRRSYLMDCSV
jgi:hypothetical protein